MSNSESSLFHDSAAFDLPVIDYAQIYENRALLEAVLDPIPDAIIIVNASDGAPLLMNRAAKRLQGIVTPNAYSHYRKLYYPDGKLVPLEDFPLTLAFRGQSLHQQEFIQTTPDGQMDYYLINSGPLRDTDGSISAGMMVCRDITERKRVTAALHNSETRFHQLYDLSPVMMHSLDEAGRICNVNQKWLEEMGYRREDVIGQRADLLMAKESAERDFAAMMSKFRGDGLLHDLPCQYVKKDGTVLRMLLNGTATIEPSGNRFSLCAVRHTTEPKQIENALEQSESRYRQIFENASDGIYTHDLQGNFTSCNQAAAEIFGYTAAEFTRLNIAQLIAPEQLPEANARFNRKLQGEMLPPHEIEVVGKDGRQLTVEASSTVIYEDGEPVGMQGIVRDVTKRRRREKEVGAMKDRFSMAFNLSPLPMHIVSIEDGRYIDVNDAFYQVTGYRREETIGKTGTELNLWVSDEERRRIGNAIRQDGYLRNMEGSFRRRDGEIRVALFSSESMVIDGKPCVLTTINDITERKRVEEALRASEERFSRLFHANPLPMSVQTYKEGRILDVNESLLATGYSREELIGRTVDEVGVWGDEETHKKITSLLKKRQPIRGVEVRLQKRSGELILGLLSAELIKISDQLCVLTSTVDITERKRQEEKILAAEREWQTTFDALPDSIILVDKSDRLLRANKTFFERNNLQPEEVMGKVAKTFLHQSSEFLSTDACPLCELRTQHRRGLIELPAGVISPFPVLASTEPIVNSDGEVIATVQVLRDLSALYSAREEAEQERGSLKATIENMAEGLMVFDDKGKVVRANSAAQKLCSVTLEQMQNGSQSSLVIEPLSDKDGNALPPGEHPVHRCLHEQRHIEEGTYEYEKSAGQKLFVSITASPVFNEQGRLTGVVVLIRDITRQQREQERLQQADKLRALGQLASGVAHNFNNALAAVIGYSQLALRKAKNPEVQKHLRVIEQSSKDAARMVERIQNFSRSRAQTDEFTLARIVDIVRDAIDITRPRWRYDAEATGIRYTVSLHWQVSEELYILCEPSELREVFVNIIFNALDAMPGGGDIGITAEADGENIHICFKDTGTGMSEEVKSRIFDPFFTTKGVLGLGLGLSESYRIVERHGGSFDVESKLQAGTAFTIHLPLKVMEIAHSRRTTTEVPAYQMRVLVVDDEELVRYALVSVLEELGHDTAQASCAEEALEFVSKQPFDLVFTDLAMPNMDGVAAAREIKARNPQVKIILMSGYSQQKVEERVKEANFIDAVMIKPFKIDEIQKILKEFIKKRSSL